MFNTRNSTVLRAQRGQAEALETWREAAGVVRIRWRTFLETGPGGRSRAFASYVEALDAEEAAAIELAAMSPSVLAA